MENGNALCDVELINNVTCKTEMFGLYDKHLTK
jgi:hypothetical protein